ncbi:amylase-binding adhesin AbpA [Streptococcus parasanguinis]|uniref:amylase-binding adhesin AbpA n=1 Tax=Streptococcus parasanguinis TaxID=1318 RepID=UPI000C7C831B|nr:amylase-binding adhesin AbpA [Streptococcus parasanguinis]PKZ96367.1 amylase-binding protein [Streptococcus parasanguinis]
MKKVLLSSVAALAVFAAAAPVFAQGENPSSSNPLIQKKYVSERDIADAVNMQVNEHDADIRAEVAKQPSVVAAQTALDAAKDYTGHDHDVKLARAQEDFDRVYNEAYNTVRNRYIQVMQQKLRDTLPNQYNDPIKDNEPNEKRIADDIKAQTGKDVTVTKDENGNYVVKDEKGNVVSTVDKNGNVVKAGAKADAKGAKALPKTSAVK